jgi:hypothetical protein
MVVSPAAIAHIANLNHYLAIKLTSSLSQQLLLIIKFLLHLFNRLIGELHFLDAFLGGLSLATFKANINFSKVGVDILDAFILAVGLSRRLNLRTIECLFLLPLSLELFSQVLLLLLGKALE